MNYPGNLFKVDFQRVGLCEFARSGRLISRFVRTQLYNRGLLSIFLEVNGANRRW